MAEPSAPVTAKGTVTIEGKRVSYTATTGRLPVFNDAGESGAEIFFVAYNADNPRKRQRPLLFAFNGGPGAASVWLHLGALGPRRVEMLPDGNMPPPPFKLVDNESSWLDCADLVFVDPVGTGFSRAVKPENTKNYANVQTDIETAGRFIRLYLSRYQKWDAPIFLVGESYGSFRVAGLSEYLAEHGVALNGVILVSTVLNMQTLSFDFGNDLPYPLYLPSYTATAWYHKKLAPELQENLEKAVAQAEEWAATEYQAALFQGDRLPPAQRQQVVQKLASFTGLSPAFVSDHNLRIDNRAFSKELLRDRREMVGFMDSRFHALNFDLSRSPGFDATVATIRPPYTSLFNRYVRKELGYSTDLEYFVLGGGIGHWDWQAKNSYADTSENLRNTFAKNGHMKLFVASGLFDLATPHFAAEYSLSQLGVIPKFRDSITLRRYKSGHMMYLDMKSLADLKRDVAEFLRSSLPPPDGR
ncbi:peptidase S10 [Geomonas sp. RF6]|uniref:S10 family peptidase n=1 Tax=Geomonas sp. RF6 TaxID=2897342 RepID=UPI001E430F15|nr:peptidase S10 [Geomonas sp. RF6]UFS69951.1 peptidase S10 [Geomonas sp. RF6]